MGVAMVAVACGGLLAGLQGLADLPLPPTGQAVLFSSADPGGGNEDHTHCLGREGPDGSWVLAEVDGPGRITRIWSANPSGDLTIQVDGVVVYAGPFAALFDGSTEPFVAPLATVFAGGALCHVPIPFREGLRITATPGEGRYHQISVLRRPEPEAFRWPPGPGLRQELDRLCPDRRPDGEGRRRLGVPVTDGATLMEWSGAGEILELGLALHGADPRRVWLTGYADGAAEPCLAAPLDLLVPDLPETRATGPGTFRLPMPFRSRMELRLRTAPGVDAGARLDLTAWYRTLPADHGRRTLHGLTRRGVNRAEQPFSLLERDGRRGHLAGVVARMQGAPAQGFSFLEGDERILADGHPWNGTGTEDFFSGAWYFRGAPAGSPFAAVTGLDARRALLTAARFFVTDPVPFERSLTVELEHGGGNDTPGSVYDTLVLWYEDGAEGHPVRQLAPLPEPRPQWREVAAADLAGAHADAQGVVTWPEGPAPEWLVTEHEAASLWRQGRVVWSVRREAPAALPEEARIFDRVRFDPVLPAIRAFRVVGPFPCAPRQGLDEVFGPERSAAAEQTYPVAEGFPGAWQEVAPDLQGMVDLIPRFPRNHVVVYAATEMTLANGGEGVLVLGSDDAVQVFVDGGKVHEHRGLRGAGRDQDRVPLTLAAGRHTLLFKVENYQGGFGFCARWEGPAATFAAR